jgi:MYXO-CTERM domain-containing protein
MCTTMSSYPGYCRPTVSKCNTDADCPAYWSCADLETPVTKTPMMGFAPPPAGADAAAPPPAQKVCTSALDSGPGRNGGGADEGTKTTTPGMGGGGPSGEQPVSPGVPPVPGADPNSNKVAAKDGGCAMSTTAGVGSSGAGLAVLALLGLALGRRRRRY